MSAEVERYWRYPPRRRGIPSPWSSRRSFSGGVGSDPIEGREQFNVPVNKARSPNSDATLAAIYLPNVLQHDRATMARLPHPDDGLAAELDEFLDDGHLVCSHCGQRARPHKMYAAEARSGDPLAALTGGPPEKHARYKLSVVVCAGCANESLFVRKWDYERDGDSSLGDPDALTEWHRRLYPIGRATKPFPNTSDAHLKPYREACAILELSPAASACMSRRCLQGILSEQGYRQKSLVQQIDGVLNEPDNRRALPASVHEAVDAIRQYGNFGAHPITDVTTLQLIEIEAGEADWCIEVVEELMDHYYERPAKLKARRDAANAKLRSGGKPILKS